MRATRWRRGTWIPCWRRRCGPSPLSSSVPRAEAQREASGAEAPSAKAAPTATPDLGRAINQYCAGCHNERAKTSATASGVVLDRVDLTRVADNAAMWEKVIRKLRAGAMPPAGMPRPDAATHDALVSFLETHAGSRGGRASQSRPAVAASAEPRRVRERDPRSARARGRSGDAAAAGRFGGRLRQQRRRARRLAGRCSSATCRRRRRSARWPSATRRSSPGSETYRIRGDASQTGQDEALPPGTRGGLMALHTFPLDGEYVIKVKLLEINLGSIRGLEYEHQLEVTVDGERVLLAPVGGPEDYTQSSLNATNVVNSLAERLQVRVKVKAGQRPVGAAFLQKTGGAGREPAAAVPAQHAHRDRSPRPAARREHDGDRAVQCRPARARRPAAARLFIVPPGEGAGRDRLCARRIISTLARRAYRRPVTDADMTSLMTFYDAGRTRGSFDRGIELAMRAVLVSPKFVFRVERDPAGVAPGSAVSHQRSGAGVAAVVLSVEQHSGRRAARRRQRGQLAQARRARSRRCAGCSPIRARRRWSTTSPGSGCTSATCAARRPTRTTFPTSTTTCGRRSSASSSCSSAASSPRIAASSI